MRTDIIGPSTRCAGSTTIITSIMNEANAPEIASEARKPCIACRELIPAGATVCSHCRQSQIPEKPSSFKKITGWVAGVTALLGLLASVFGGIQWAENHWTQRTDIKTELSVAESQTERGEYERAVAVYQDILKKDAQNHQAADEQVTAAMRWVENFGVLTRQGQSATDVAAPKLDTILPILDAGLARAKGPRSSDILAHIGWVHWLNRHIAETEIGPAAEQSFRKALEINPANVYANAMLGNWLLQNNGSQPEAFSHFATAVQSGKERPWVRTMQLGGLIYNEAPQARAELVKVANDMRKNNESLSEDEKARILSFNYDLSPYHAADLAEALAAVPPSDSWATYQWLDDVQKTEASDINMQQIRRDYVEANILELSGKQLEALSKYEALQAKLRNSDSTLVGQVDKAVKRMTSAK